MAKIKRDPRDPVLYQGNAFLQSRKHFGILEHRLLRMAIADIRPQLKNSTCSDNELRPFRMQTGELIKRLGGESNNRIYEQLRAACRNLGKMIEVGDSRHFEMYSIFDRIIFDADSGIEMQFSPSMGKFLLQLEQGNYTRMLLRLAFALSSTYSLILLETMLQYRGKAQGGRIEREISLEQLRFSLDVPADAYGGRMNNFRRYVIDAAIREINEKTDYFIEPGYGMLRGKRNSVAGFVFVLHLPEGEQRAETT